MHTEGSRVRAHNVSKKRLITADLCSIINPSYALSNGQNAMATFHHRVTSLKKGKAAARANYIARRGKHRGREDLVWTSFGNLPTWANNDPKKFWKASDAYERRNGCAAREERIALPIELNLTQQRRLVDQLVGELVGDRPYELGVHGVTAAIGQVLNLHLHLLHSERQPDGFERSASQTFKRFSATDPKKGGCRKCSGGLTRFQQGNALRAKRRKIEEVTNEALEHGGETSRVDARSFLDRGISKQPERHFGPSRVRSMSEIEKADLRRKRTETIIGR